MTTFPTPDEDAGYAEQLELPLNDMRAEFPLSDMRVEFLREELDLITDESFGEAIGVQAQTLAVWRSESKGPAYTKLGKGVFYRREDIKRWASLQTIYTNDDPAPEFVPEWRKAA